MTQKRGMTLIELVVAMTLFSVVATAAIGGFIAISKLKILMVDMKNTQQKARLIYETIYRSSKEASGVVRDGNWLFLQYTSTTSSKVFEPVLTGSPLTITSYLYYNCSVSVSTKAELTAAKSASSCTSEDLLAGSATSRYQLASLSFVRSYTLPDTLDVSIVLHDASSVNNMDPDININNKVILENVK